MNLIRRGVGTILAAAVCTVAAAVPPPVQQPPWGAHVDAVFREWRGQSSPGCAVGVYKDGAIVFERGYGMADLEHDVPIAADSVFYTGSLSKQFTAFAAALAIQQGRLSADDPIRKFLPELPAYADGITVRHLVHHTSGLRDYNTLLSIAGRRGDEAYDNPTVLRITARQKKLNFTPGEEYLYSNTGYTLLATIVERATGTPFAAFAEARIFKPLGMDATHYHVDSGRLVKGRAFAYARGADGTWRLDTPGNERAGAGGLYTTVRDLVRWDDNFYRAAVGGEDLIRRVQTPGRLNDGSALSYAWGLQLGTYRGMSIVEHAGSLGGYRAHMIRFPERHTSFVALCNLGSIAPGGLVRQVADVVIGSAFTEARASAVAPSEAASAAGRRRSGAPGDPLPRREPQGPRSDYTGVYYSDEIDATFTVSARGDAWLLRRDTDAEPAPLQPSGGGAFLWRGMTLRFGAAANGSAGVLIVDAGRVRDIRFTRIDPKEPAR